MTNDTSRAIRRVHNPRLELKMDSVCNQIQGIFAKGI